MRIGPITMHPELSKHLDRAWRLVLRLPIVESFQPEPRILLKRLFVWYRRQPLPSSPPPLPPPF